MLLVGGIAVARYHRHFRLLLTGLVVVACATAVVLARGLASGQVAATVGGRFSLDQQASPIGLGARRRPASSSRSFSCSRRIRICSGSLRWVRCH